MWNQVHLTHLQQANKLRFCLPFNLFQLQLDKNNPGGRAYIYTLYFGNWVLIKETNYHESLDEAKTGALSWAKQHVEDELNTINLLVTELCA